MGGEDDDFFFVAPRMFADDVASTVDLHIEAADANSLRAAARCAPGMARGDFGQTNLPAR